jgi:plasmid stabilization system protein ParE
MPRLRYVVAVVAAVWLAVWVVVIGAHSVMGDGHSESSVPHPAHALVASLGSEFAVNVDHPHVGNGSSSAHPEQFSAAVLTRSGAAVAALAVLGAVLAVAVAGGLARLGAPAGRGPPRARAFSVTGQEVLTRFCLSRR